MRELLAALLAVALLTILNVEAATSRLVAPLSSMTSRSLLDGTRRLHRWVLVPRGGSDEYDEYDEDDIEFEAEEVELVDEDEDEETEDECDEEEEEEDIVMVKSAVKATEKAQAKKASVTKKAVSAKLSTPKKKRPSLIKRYVPYIVRVCFSPATMFAMTKAYFASLFNLNYLAEDSSQDLRSALEEKAKKSGSTGGGRKGKRHMRPGQAKTLSDLPQLNT